MIKNLFKNYIAPISVFAGGMIGVGFLSLPYIAKQTGILIMLAYFLILTVLVVCINLIFAEISLKTPDFKRFPGFVGYYLGKPAKIFSLLSVIFGTIGILLIYLIVGGEFLASVFSPIFNGNTFIYTLVYFCLVSFVIYFDIKIVSKAEFWILAFLFLSLIFIFVEGFYCIKISHLFIFGPVGISKNLFLPYGPLLFSLWGIGLIPETEEMIKGNKKHLKKILTISTIVVSVFYLIFTILILGISGQSTTQTAFTGLAKFLGNSVVSIAVFVGVLATFTAFITQGIIFKKVLMYDLKIKHWQAFIMTCFTPFILFLLGVKSFIVLISFVGGILLGLDGILILLMYKKIGGKIKYILPLALIFIFGIIYQLIYFLK